MDELDQQPRRPRAAAALGRMPTGAKVFLILSGALLPLALIALFTTLQTTRLADVEARARVNVAATESAAVLRGFFANHAAQLRDALAALERNSGDAPACSRLEGTFASLSASGVRFAVANRQGRVLCGERFTVAGAALLQPNDIEAAIVPGEGLTMRIAGRSGGTATAFYPVAALDALGRPSGFMPHYGAALVQDGNRLTLRELVMPGPWDRREVVRHTLGLDRVALEMAMPGAPITAPLLVAMLLPLLMWIAAAGIAWFVVDRLLIRPLRRLHTSVGNYQPGEVIDAERFGTLPAEEIRELGETFREISRTVRAHEADLAEGLVRQTRLTREVHHRVKNNLQVIASLINFHARSARGPEAAEAYASIQRRVDALAVVHRHHYAELEENRGVELRSVIGELAANIRATAPPQSSQLGITLDVAPFLVTQDVAVAVAFVLTEIIELAMSCNPTAQIRISVRLGEEPNRAQLRVSSPALIESAAMESLLENRYGRVIGGLTRQLRTKMHYDPLVGAYEMAIAITGES